MDKKIAEAIGLLRHKIISPVLMEQGKHQMVYFREIEGREFDVPGKGPKIFKASTMKGWLNRYRKHGFTGIIPKVRCDVGHFRKLDEASVKKIVSLRQENMRIPVTQFYIRCQQENILGDPPICEATLRRLLEVKGIKKLSNGKLNPRKRYEMGRFGELWVGDFCHTIYVQDGARKRKAILFLIIDDHTRLVVGCKFSFCETTMPIELVFKETILAYGLPDRLYVDNGPSFSSHYLAKVCANVGIGLVHSKPYDSPSRGKVERVFRTVRSSFLTGIRPGEVITLDQLNNLFKKWLRDSYHHKMHKGINARPIDRYTISVAEYPLKRIDPDILNEHFMVSCQRNVNKDSTLSYRGIIYEVPPIFIGKRVEIRHVQDDIADVYIYEDDRRVIRIIPVDSRENGRIYKGPSSESHIVSFSKKKEETK